MDLIFPMAGGLTKPRAHVQVDKVGNLSESSSSSGTDSDSDADTQNMNLNASTTTLLKSVDDLPDIDFIRRADDDVGVTDGIDM